MGDREAFWLDHRLDHRLDRETDREPDTETDSEPGREPDRKTAHARDRDRAAGPSRYAEHVRRGVAAFDGSWGDIAPVTFACAAWRLATTPTPPYVRWHRRILSAACDRNPCIATRSVRTCPDRPVSTSRRSAWAA